MLCTLLRSELCAYKLCRPAAASLLLLWGQLSRGLLFAGTQLHRAIPQYDGMTAKTSKVSFSDLNLITRLNST